MEPMCSVGVTCLRGDSFVLCESGNGANELHGVPNVENGFTVPGFEIGVAQGFAEDEAELAVITRRLNGAQAGVHQAEIRLAADGRPIASYQTTETRIVPSPDGQGNLTGRGCDWYLCPRWHLGRQLKHWYDRRRASCFDSAQHDD